MTAPKAPPVVAPTDEDLLFRIIGLIMGLLGRGLRYWFRRTRQDLLVGVIYVLTWPPTLGLLIQNARQALACATAPAYTTPEPIWPLAGQPLSTVGLGLVASVLLLTWIVDRRRAQALLHRTPEPVVPPAPLQYGISEWIVGWVVARTWSPDPGEWTLQRTRELFAIAAEHLRVNLLVVAPPGAGKTSMILHPILRLCRRIGAACLVFDVKGDAADLRDRPDFDPREFHLTFDLAHPERSARLNLAAGGTPREIGEQLGEALIYDPASDKAYFVDNAKDALGTLFAAHTAVYGSIPTLRQALVYLRDAHARADLLAELQRAGYPDNSDEVLDLQRIDRLQEGKNDILGTLDLALAPLARGAVASLLVSDDSGLRIPDLLRQGARVRIILPVYRQPRVAPIVGRLILAQFTNAVLDPACDRHRLKVALVDEAHWFVTPSLPAGMAQARANFGGYVLALQDLPQITDATLREKIWSVATNKLVLAGVGDYDAEKFSRIWGAQERLYITRARRCGSSTNTSRSTGRGQHTGGGGFGGLGVGGNSTQRSTAQSSSTNEGQSESAQTRLRPDWLPGEIHGLPERHVIVERRDAQGHVTPPTLIALDRALTDLVQIQQDLQLFKQVGRRDAAAFCTLPRQHHSAASSHIAPAEQKDSGEASSADVNADSWDLAGAMLQDRLALELNTAQALLNLARQNGRDSNYLLAILDDVQSDPNIRQPARVFARLVTANQEPRAQDGRRFYELGTEA